MRKHQEQEQSNQTDCVLYARVSTAKQATENASIDTQLEAGRTFAKARGWNVVSEFVDPGASAWKDDGRPQFDRMIQQARSPTPSFQVIVVYDQSRFYRNVRKSVSGAWIPRFS